MKCINVTYESASGDSHTHPIAVFTPEKYDDMERILSELKPFEESGGPYFETDDYYAPPTNPVTAVEIRPKSQAELRREFLDVLRDYHQTPTPLDYETALERIRIRREENSTPMKSQLPPEVGASSLEPPDQL